MGSSLPLIILFNLPWGGFRAIGIAGMLLLLAVASLGAAGLAAMMGQRLQSLGLNSSQVGATVRGAIALELAAVFPLVGWFFVIPLTFITTLGAAVFSLLGWLPRSQTQNTVPQLVQEHQVSA